MSDDPPRSRAARQAAQDALVRVVRHYGSTPHRRKRPSPSLTATASERSTFEAPGSRPETEPNRPMLDDLAANFADPRAQGPQAYAGQVTIDDPEIDSATAAADAVLAVDVFLGLDR